MTFHFNITCLCQSLSLLQFLMQNFCLHFPFKTSVLLAPLILSTFNLSTHEYLVRRNNHKTLQYTDLSSFVLFIHLRSKYYPEHPLSLCYPFKIRAKMYFVRCILIFNILDSRLTHKTFKSQGSKLVPNVKKIL